MDDWLGMLMVAAFGAAAGILVGAVTLFIQWLRPSTRKCPDCETPIANVSLPQNFKQWVTRRRSCPACGCEVTYKGGKVGP
jgi:hypothetical protein